MKVDASREPDELQDYFRALADSTRLRIIKYLWRHKDSSVTDLCRELRVSQPLMSWHLRILRRAGLVTTHRTGRIVHCSLNGDIVSRGDEMLAAFLSEPEGPAGDELLARSS